MWASAGWGVTDLAKSTISPTAWWINIVTMQSRNGSVAWNSFSNCGQVEGRKIFLNFRASSTFYCFKYTKLITSILVEYFVHKIYKISLF